jgi:hypothetical protein
MPRPRRRHRRHQRRLPCLQARPYLGSPTLATPRSPTLATRRTSVGAPDRPHSGPSCGEASGAEPWGVWRYSAVCGTDGRRFASNRRLSGPAVCRLDRSGGAYRLVAAKIGSTQAVDFISDEPGYAGTMTMTWEVATVESGTRVEIRRKCSGPGGHCERRSGRSALAFLLGRRRCRRPYAGASTTSGLCREAERRAGVR